MQPGGVARLNLSDVLVVRRIDDHCVQPTRRKHRVVVIELLSAGNSRVLALGFGALFCAGIGHSGDLELRHREGVAESIAGESAGADDAEPNLLCHAP